MYVSARRYSAPARSTELMGDLTVLQDRTACWQVAGRARTGRCAIGRSGVSDTKKEGDGTTPAGRYPYRRVLYRRDRIPAPECALPLSPISPDDGWCDAPPDPAYNRPVMLPYPGSAEHLWRDDFLYDLIVVLGYNDAPVIPGRGSAIFLHLAAPDYRATEGCVALALDDLLAVLADAGPGDGIDIRLSATG